MYRILSLFPLFACEQAQTATLHDAQPLSEALSYAQPQPLLELEDRLQGLLQRENCRQNPKSTSTDWDCAPESPLRIRGRLEIAEKKWIQGERFTIIQQDNIIFYLDGAIEFFEVGDLLQLNMAGQFCGIHRTLEW